MVQKTQCKLPLKLLVEDLHELHELEDSAAQLIRLRQEFVRRVSKAAEKSMYIKVLRSMGCITHAGGGWKARELSAAFQFDDHMNITVDFMPNQLPLNHPNHPGYPIDNTMLKTLLHTKLLSDEEKRELLVRNNILLKQSTPGESND